MLIDFIGEWIAHDAYFKIGLLKREHGSSSKDHERKLYKLESILADCSRYLWIWFAS